MSLSPSVDSGQGTWAIGMMTRVSSVQSFPSSIGISGWTGFAPLTLAKEAGIFKKNGLDVTIK